MGKTEKSRPSQSFTPRFSRLELREMEKLLKEAKDDVLEETCHQKLAEEFNRAPCRAGPRAIHAKHVQKWFVNRRREGHAAEKAVSVSLLAASKGLASDKAASAPVASKKKAVHKAGSTLVASKEVAAVPDSSLSNNAITSSSNVSKDIIDKFRDIADIKFEAKSSTDGGWYDVDKFLSYRFEPDELEVRVRYQGFGPEEDEWVNVKKAIRMRSIPLEYSECLRVGVGDLVLCYREKNDRASHFDAHVKSIQRRHHDIRGCRCLFSVQYDHDEIEETVTLRSLCQRPLY